MVSREKLYMHGLEEKSRSLDSLMLAHVVLQCALCLREKSDISC